MFPFARDSCLENMTMIWNIFYFFWLALLHQSHIFSLSILFKVFWCCFMTQVNGSANVFCCRRFHFQNCLTFKHDELCHNFCFSWSFSSCWLFYSDLPDWNADNLARSPTQKKILITLLFPFSLSFLLSESFKWVHLCSVCLEYVAIETTALSFPFLVN